MRKPSFFRFFLFFGFVAALAAGLIYVAAGNIDVAYLKDFVQKKVKEEIGRELTISEDLELKLYPVPAINIASVSLANVAQGEAAHYAQVRNVTVYPNIWSLLKGDVQISSVSADGANLWLERYADGSNNWTFKQKRTYKAPKWSVASLELNNAELTFNDAVTSRQMRATIAKATATTTAATAVESSGVIKGSVSGLFQGLPVSAGVELDNFESLFTRTPTTGLVNGTLDGAALELSGTIDHLLSFSGIDLNTGLKGLSLDAVEKVFDFNIPVDGSLDVATRLTGDLRLMHAQELVASLKTEHELVTAQGEVKDVFKTRHSELSVIAEAQSIASSLARFDQKPPMDGQLKARGVLSGKDRHFSLKLDEAKFTNKQISAAASGDIMDLNRLQKIRLDVSGSTESLAAVNKDVAERLDIKSPITFTTVVAREKDVTHLQNLKLEFAQEGKRVQVSGDLPNLKQPKNFSARIEATAASLKDFSNHINFDLPQTGAASLSVELKRSGGKDRLDLSVNAASPEISFKANGSLMPESAADSFAINFAGSAKNTAAIKSLIKQTLPDLNNIQIDGSIGQSEKTGSYRLDANVNASGISGTYRGTVEKSGSRLQGNVSISADDINLLQPVVGATALLRGKTSFQSAISKSNDAVELKEIVLIADKADIKGSLTITPESGDGASAVSGALTLAALDFRTPKNNASASSAQGSGEKRKRRLFSGDLIPTQSLKDKNLAIDLTVGKVFTDVTVFENANLELALKDSRLNVPGFYAHIGEQGRLNGALVFDVSNQTPNLSLSMNTRAIKPESLSWFGNGDLIRDGYVGLNAEVRGSGSSVAEIMAGLNGYILTDIEKSKLQQAGLKLVGGDILTQIIRLVNPFNKKRKDMSVYCGFVGFNVKNGVASTAKGIAVKGADLALFGAGEINFKNEKLEIVIKPKARKGLGLSASSVAKFVRIGGRLANPKAEADPKGLLSTGATVGAALASGGISLLLQGAYDRVKASGDICERARDEFRDEAIKIHGNKASGFLRKGHRANQ